MAAFGQAAHQFQGTGPYRRIWSGTPCSAMQATVFLPGNGQGITYGQHGDTAFVYGGGWGSGGQAVDAGFMHNPGTDTWSLFIKYMGSPEAFGATPNIRLKPNQPVTFVFSAPADGSLRIETSGEAIDVNTGAGLGVQNFVVECDNVDGFPADGTEVILKRMTSIAQQPENLSSGSQLIGVVWSGVKFGTDPANLTPWSIVPPGGTMSYPHGPEVAVNYDNDTWETVSIDLS